MDLDPQIAETIVGSLKDIINHEINLFDTTGSIIASTDRARIGTSHDGARLALRTRENVTIDSEHEFKGARHGINVPVLFNGSPVAVIGITGERSEVEPFGNVIKKMTEILIRENWEQITRFDQRERMMGLVNQLCLRHHDPSLASYLGSVLKVDLSRPRRAVVGKFTACPTKPADTESPYALLYGRFQQMPGSFFSYYDDQIRIFVDEREAKGLPALLRGIRRDLMDHQRLSVTFGIGDVAAESSEYWRSYEEACKTADWLLFTDQGSIGGYDEMDYGIFLSSIPREEAERFVSHVLGGLSEKQVDDFREVFDAYTRHDGSILHSAEELFLHKNTMQNRLNKIADKTGYNPRQLSGYVILAIAFSLRQYLRFEGSSSVGA